MAKLCPRAGNARRRLLKRNLFLRSAALREGVTDRLRNFAFDVLPRLTLVVDVIEL